MIAIDTNIWIYLHDSRYPRKQELVQNLIDIAAPVVLPWQVGCEFIAVSRKIAAFPSVEDAWNYLEKMKKAANLIALPEVADWQEARRLQQTDMLSFWDALLVSLCLRVGARRLYTEDMGSPRKIRSLELVNPFA
jgi:predicted nucleic acid-binding protein